jgi:hypothetical protein
MQAGTILSRFRPGVASIDSYTEYSASGSGLHVVVESAVTPETEAVKLPYPDGSALDILGPGCFVKTTGNAYPGKPLEVRDGTAIVRAALKIIEDQKPKSAPTPMNQAPSKYTDDEVLAMLRRAENAAKFADLFDDGDVDKHHGGDESGADLGLLNMLVFYTQDPEQLDRLFRRSALMRSKWDSKRGQSTYGWNSINRALDGYVGETYKAPSKNGQRRDSNDSNDSDFKKLADMPDAAEFPLGVFPPSVKRFIEDTTTSIGCPIDFVGNATIAAFSAAIGDSRIAVIKRDWTEGANLYLMIVAEVGTKKTPAQRAAFKPLRRQQVKAKKVYEDRKAEYQRALEAAKKSKDTEAEVPSKPTMHRVYVDDATVEKLCGLMGENPRGLIMIKDELSGWLSGMDQYKQGGKGSDRQFYLAAHSLSPVAVDRKNSDEPALIARPYLSIWGGIQPSVLTDFGKDRGDGLIDRFLTSYPEPMHSRWTDFEVSREVEDAYDGVIRHLYGLSHPQHPETGEHFAVEVPMTPEAKAIFASYHDELNVERETPGFPKRLEGVWSKLVGHTARLALIVALTRIAELRRMGDYPDEVITAQDMEGAKALAEYFKAHARRTFTGLYGDSIIDKLAADLYTYIVSMGGTWEGSAEELHAALDSDHRPARPEDLSKMVRAICKRTPALKLEDLPRAATRRAFRLTLEKPVIAVIAVTDRPDSPDAADDTDF